MVAEPYQPPLRVRISKPFFKRIFNLWDHHVFTYFRRTEIFTGHRSSFNKILFHVKPIKGSIKDFDFEFITRNDSWGAESNKLQITGYAETKNNKKLNFQIPIKKLKLLYEISKKPDEKWGFDSF